MARLDFFFASRAQQFWAKGDLINVNDDRVCASRSCGAAKLRSVPHYRQHADHAVKSDWDRVCEISAQVCVSARQRICSYSLIVSDDDLAIVAIPLARTCTPFIFGSTALFVHGEHRLAFLQVLCLTRSQQFHHDQHCIHHIINGQPFGSRLAIRSSVLYVCQQAT